MADNITLNPGVGGSTVRTDDVGGAHIPVSKIVLGIENADNGYVAASNPLPITLAADGGISQTVDSPQLPSALTGSGNLKVAIQEATFTVTSGPVTLTTGAAYATINNSNLDTTNFGNTYIAYFLENTGANSIDAKVQASIDNTNWFDLTTLDHTGVERATADITIGAGANAAAIIAPGLDSGAKSAFRYFRVQARNTVPPNNSTARATGFAK